MNYSTAVYQARSRDWKGPIASIFLFLLTAGFLFYNEIVVRRMIPPYLGGFFGVTSLACLLFLGAFTFKSLLASANSRVIYSRVFVSLLAWLLLLTAFHWATGGHGAYKEEAVQQVCESLLLWFAMFSIGFWLRPSRNLNFAISGFILASTVFLVSYYLHSGSLTYIALLGNADLGDAVSSYQGYARSIAILSMYVLSLNYDRPLRALLVSSACMLCLFFASARSELVGFIVVALVLFALTLPVKSFLSLRLRLPNLLVLLAFLSSLVILTVYLNGLQVNSRILQLFSISESSSYIARDELLSIGLVHIASNPFLGVYGGHILDTGERGGYIHNILSAWAGFGLPAFLFFFYLQSSATIGSFMLFRRAPSHLLSFSFLVNLFSSILLLTAKPVFWIVPPLGWGLFLQVLISMPKVSSKNDLFAHVFGQ